MSTGRVSRLFFSCVAALGVAPGCTAITSGDFEVREPPLECGNASDSSRSDMRVELLGMNAHLADLTQVDLVRVQTIGGVRMRRLVARAVYEPLGATDLSITLPCTVVPGEHEIDMYADRNENGVFDPCPDREGTGFCDDHQWRLMLSPDGTLSYQHEGDFDDLSQDAALPRGALRFEAALQNMSSFAGKLAELHVRRQLDNEQYETVLRYRLGDAASRPVVQVEGIGEVSEQYEVAIWIDTNDNGSYDAPSAIGIEDRDYAVAIDAEAEPGGLRVVFDGENPPDPEDVGLAPREER